MSNERVSQLVERTVASWVFERAEKMDGDSVETKADQSELMLDKKSTLLGLH